MDWITALVAFVAVLAASFGGTRAVLGILRRRAILDLPNERSSHETPTPRGGGLAVVAVVVVAWIIIRLSAPESAFEIVVVCGGAVGLAAISWIDDLRRIESPLAAHRTNPGRRRGPRLDAGTRPLLWRPTARCARPHRRRRGVDLVHKSLQFHGWDRRHRGDRSRLHRGRGRGDGARRQPRRTDHPVRPDGDGGGARLPVVELATGKNIHGRCR